MATAAWQQRIFPDRHHWPDQLVSVTGSRGRIRGNLSQELRFIRPIYTQVCRRRWYAEAWPALHVCSAICTVIWSTRGACSDVTHTAFVLCVVGMEKRHLTRDQGCEGQLIPMVSIDPQVEERQCFRVMHMLQ